ncbi:MAG: hypothetical protein NTW86_06045, partial [Candidatus Sumerlaeota bacterium]|nr:hypothetical protein [Candidatus Sumerlaeota bacterium]
RNFRRRHQGIDWNRLFATVDSHRSGCSFISGAALFSRDGNNLVLSSFPHPMRESHAAIS